MAANRSLGQRARSLAELGTERFDLLVVGGGITGAGVVLEATLRGYRCGLVERADFASGTSSRSSKMIHGGLRYLARAEIAFARESLAERGILLRTAPSLVQPLPFLVPIAGPVDFAKSVVALGLYEWLAMDGTLPRRRRLGPTEIAEFFPPLRGQVKDAVLYYDAQADDARLTLAVLRAAVGNGAVIANHASATGIDPLPGEVRVEITDVLSGMAISVRAGRVVLAVGAWLGELTKQTGLPPVAVRPAKGIHLVFPQTQPPVRASLVLRHPDGRYIFLEPWKGHLLLGTTDTACDSSELDYLASTADEVEYLLVGLRAALPNWPSTPVAAWAGVRPLLNEPGRRTTDLSRTDRIFEVARGVVAIAGGKLTTFRRVAKRTLDFVDQLASRPKQATKWATLAEILPRAAEALPGDRLLPSLIYTARDLEHIARDEMVATLDDALTQRLGLSLVAPVEAAEHARRWATIIGSVLGWDDPERDRQVTNYRARLGRFMPPAG